MVVVNVMDNDKGHGTGMEKGYGEGYVMDKGTGNFD